MPTATYEIKNFFPNSTDVIYNRELMQSTGTLTINIRAGYERLAEALILRIKNQATGEMAYADRLINFPTEGIEVEYPELTISLPSNTSNDYQSQTCICDLAVVPSKTKIASVSIELIVETGTFHINFNNGRPIVYEGEYCVSDDWEKDAFIETEASCDAYAKLKFTNISGALDPNILTSNLTILLGDEQTPIKVGEPFFLRGYGRNTEIYFEWTGVDSGGDIKFTIELKAVQAVGNPLQDFDFGFTDTSTVDRNSMIAGSRIKSTVTNGTKFTDYTMSVCWATSPEYATTVSYYPRDGYALSPTVTVQNAEYEWSPKTGELKLWNPVQIDNTPVYVTVTSYVDAEKTIRAELIKQSGLAASMVRNAHSAYGQMLDVSETADNDIFRSLETSECLILFELRPRESVGDMSETEDDDDTISYYKAYRVHVIMYGEPATTLSHTVVARMRTELCRMNLQSKDIHFERVSYPVAFHEYKNMRLWERADFDIDISCKTQILPVESEEPFAAFSALDIRTTNE